MVQNEVNNVDADALKVSISVYSFALNKSMEELRKAYKGRESNNAV